LRPPRLVARLSSTAPSPDAPRAALTAPPPPPPLQLHHADARGSNDEQIDVEAATPVGDQLQATPRAVRILVGERGADVLQAGALMGVLRGGDLDPAVWTERHRLHLPSRA